MELLGTTTGIIITAVVAALALTVLIGGVYLAAHQQESRLIRERQQQAGDAAGAAEIASRPGKSALDQAAAQHVPEGSHPHGKRSSWVLVAVLTAAFSAGGAAIILHDWPLLWACAGIVVLAIPAGKVIGIMNDTVSWEDPPAAADPSRGREAAPRQDQPDYARSEPRS